MEKRKIVINREMAVYIKNAANAFKQFNVASSRNLYDDKKVAKERHYCKIMFFKNIDRILDSINVNKKDEFSILMRIVNFIMQQNYHAVWPWSECDNYSKIPVIKTEDLYYFNGGFPSNRWEFLSRIKTIIDVVYKRNDMAPKITDMIDKEI